MKYFFTIPAVLLAACTSSGTQPVSVQTGESQTFSAGLVDGNISKDESLAFQLAREGSQDEKDSEPMQDNLQQPRQVYITARTTEFKYANYMLEWVKKIERVGSLNFPDEARREGISGKLLMDVAINADGTVHSIAMLRPSGNKVIDDAARRIVELAAPFSPFPPEIARDADVVHITRTWEFEFKERKEPH